MKLWKFMRKYKIRKNKIKEIYDKVQIQEK